MTSKIKPSVLIFVDWFYPGYLAGGPVQSIVSLVENMREEIDFWVVTSDRDLNSTVPYLDVPLNKWIDSEKGCKVYYISPDKLGKRLIRELLAETVCSTVYINSLFSKNFSILPLLLLKNEFKHLRVVLAPRGMLGRGALAIKRIKKMIFLFYCKISRLHKNVIWHATSLTEMREIKRVLGEVKITTISNFPKRITYKNGITKVKGSLCIYFSGRLSEKKNLSFALDILSNINGPIIKFNIFGIIEDQSYWEKCSRKIKTFPSNIHVEYKGTYQPGEAETIINSHHVLLFPTLNENYGHSIVESLLCGCPVIISDQTPWKDLQKYGAGFSLPLTDKEAFAEAIEGYAAMSEMEFDKARKQAIYYIEQKTEVETNRQLYRELFNV